MNSSNSDLRDDPSQEMLQDGEIFEERFQILSVIGKGGTGTVYKAKQRHMDKIVAIKTLSASQSWHDDDTFLRFEKESRAASALGHTNIISILDFGKSADGRAYLVMEYLGSKNLDDVLKSQELIDVKRFYRIFSQICDGLEHAHKKGIIHRDIKPSNIMLLDDEEVKDIVKVVDFGLAKLTSRDDDIQLTKTGAIMGTPLYMSPEQCRGLDLDHRSDIYSLGCVMYKALTGVSPVVGATPLDTLYRHTTEEPPTFADSAPDLSFPDALEKAILKSLKKDPNDRQQSMAELRTDLRDAILMPANSGMIETAAAAALAGQKIIESHAASTVSQPLVLTAQPASAGVDFRSRIKSPAIIAGAAALALSAICGTIYIVGKQGGDGKAARTSTSPPLVAAVTEQPKINSSEDADYRDDVKMTPETQLAMQERIRDGETTIANPNGGSDRVTASSALAPHAVRPQSSPIDRGGTDAKVVAQFIRQKKNQLLHQAAEAFNVGDWKQAKALYEQSITDDLGGVSGLDKFATSAHIIDCDIKLSLSMSVIKECLDNALTLFNKQRKAMIVEIGQRQDALYIWKVYGRITVDAAKRTSGEASESYWTWASFFYQHAYKSWKDDNKNTAQYQTFLEQYLVVAAHSDRSMVREIQMALKKSGISTKLPAENLPSKQHTKRQPASRAANGHHGRLVGPGIRVY